ncbi:MAG: hypothetical protein JWO56_1747 [Acidobacteria bacterium]|nr:hypothetical protein [Acidobacteriota bacterium]
MARGFESKSAQSAKEDAEASRAARPRRDDRTQEDLDRERQRESLMLSRRRIEHELAATTSVMRRTSLEAALKHLDGEIAKVS